ncbi:MAG: homoserine kinase [Myxococcales bacterium]|nr:homoserine kinase [Myxococcales bacterium]MDP3504559.1 homoserine kinase [Myxococcales bacterium]
MKEARAFAPASIGNVAVGFDMLGHALHGAGDTATVRLTTSGTVRVTAIRGVVADLPTRAKDNTAGRALLGLAKLRPGVGFEVELDKGIPLGSGMGGSAASAVAALVAANSLLTKPVSLEEIYSLAMQGEAVASGSMHGDNVAPMLLGGLVIAPARGAPVRVPVPSNLFCTLVHPHFVLETRRARAALKGAYELHDFVVQSEGLALLLAGCWQKDFELIRRGFRDVLVEPRRARLIPGFARVKEAALDSGALGSSISGGGPSVFAWFDSKAKAQKAGDAMAQAFHSVKLGADVLISKVAAPGARVL